MENNNTLIALVARHGDSLMNDLGLFRSWRDVPLTKKGVVQAEMARDFAKDYDIGNVICSPLLRSFVTADIIAQPHNLIVYQHRGLFPWQLGIFTGLDKDQNQDALKLFVDNPEVVVPSGESLDEFEQRQFTFWKAALEQIKVLTLFVCHNSTITAMAKFMDDTDKDLSKDEVISTGGILGVYKSGNSYRFKVLFGEEKSSPAVMGS